MPIRILIVDDSVVYRSIVKSALKENSQFEVVGVASNGKIALEKLSQTQVDLVILDLEMPEMDGLQTLINLKATQHKCKVLVFASTTLRGAECALEAMKIGASDFVPKPGHESASANSDDPIEKIKSLLEPRILALFAVSKIGNTSPNSSLSLQRKSLGQIRPIWDLFRPKAVVIGSSTGGPTVLEKVFSQLGPPLTCPILIVQHMPPVFTLTLAKRLQSISGLDVREAVDGEILETSRVYIAPGNFHMSLYQSNGKVQIKLDQGPQVNSVRPAVDPLFSTAAQIFKSTCLGVVFTGMGADGMVGAQQIKEAGGSVLIQNEASCVVFGMPGAVKSSGAYDFELTPDEISSLLIEKATGAKFNAQLKKGS